MLLYYDGVFFYSYFTYYGVRICPKAIQERLQQPAMLRAAGVRRSAQVPISMYCTYYYIIGHGSMDSYYTCAYCYYYCTFRII